MINPKAVRCFSVVLVLCALLQITSASLGDRLPEFHECVEVSQRIKEAINAHNNRFAKPKTAFPARINSVSHR